MVKLNGAPGTESFGRRKRKDALECDQGGGVATYLPRELEGKKP